MKFNDKTYNVLKWICMIVLPALGTFYFAIAGIWNLPYAEQIVGTIAAVTTLLGALIGISTATYNRDTLINYVGANISEFTDGKGEDEDGNISVG